MYTVTFKLGTNQQAIRSYSVNDWKRAYEMFTSVPLANGETASVLIAGDRVRHREGKA